MSIIEGRSTPDGLDIQEGPGWDKPTFDHPDVLYHETAAKNRDSILKTGIRIDFSDGAGIFFTDTPEHSTQIDVWAVDVSGIALERDATTNHHHLGQEWWVTYDLDVIDPTRLRLAASV